MADRRDQKWEERADRAYTNVTDRPGRTLTKWFLIALALILALSILGGIIAYVGSWGEEAKRVTSPENVRDQNTEIIRDWEAMESTAKIACRAKAAGTSEKEEGDPTILEDPSVAYESNYETPRQDYDRRMANLYEAQAVRGLPLPSNLRSYPKVAPTLEEMQAQVC